MPREGDALRGFLTGVRVLEIADELGEYCGKVLAGLGADVVKIEPPEGERTRGYGPFYQDQPHRDRSLYFWHYNFGKRSITLDLEATEGQQHFRELAKRSDVVLETRPRGYLEERGIGFESLTALNKSIILARISPFGDTGPWADYAGSDLVHLALGGVMMNCGYDPDPTGFYETPPVAPQAWQAYHIVGELMVIALLGALYYRQATGKGQQLTSAVHDAVSKATESDITHWIYTRGPLHSRRTGRHSFVAQSGRLSQEMTKDGRWMLPYRTYLPTARGSDDFKQMVAIFDKYGMADDLKEDKYSDQSYWSPYVDAHVGDVVARFVRKFLFSREIWREFQEAGLAWAPIRKPEDNLTDPHWKLRDTFIRVEHPELKQSFTYVGAKWMAPGIPWRKGPRAPLLGEHSIEVLEAISEEPVRILASPDPTPEPVLSKHSKPFALAGVRMIDLGWILASGGAGRFLAAQGAEVIKVEHKSRLDPGRMRNGLVPDGGRALRDRATDCIELPRATSPNRSGHFMDINAGKRAISLNLKTPVGRELFASLLKKADVLSEGYSPGTMERMGFGYEQLKTINHGIVYAQQSGMGQIGTYGRTRSYGPVAQGFSGLTEMSGLPEPFPPAGIGFSYLDWFGAYNLATAILAGLYRRKVTGEGCWIDSSQVEAGTFLTGSSILDFSANNRRWKRFGNRSPYKLAAPHGAYRTLGDDKWIAIACFDEKQWAGLLKVFGSPSWGDDIKFRSQPSRVANQDELDSLVSDVTVQRDGFDLMHELQGVGVPAGVCQTAEDRYDRDPQLKHLEWLVELNQTEIGTWPVKEFPVKFSQTPTYMGGIVDRSGPNYAEDNEYVYGEILGLPLSRIRQLAVEGVI